MHIYIYSGCGFKMLEGFTCCGIVVKGQKGLEGKQGAGTYQKGLRRDTGESCSRGCLGSDSGWLGYACWMTIMI